MRCLKLVILIATITLQPVFSGLAAADAVSTAAISSDNTLSIASENNSDNLPTAKQEENLDRSNEPLINKENSNSLPAANDGKTLPRQTAENKTAPAFTLPNIILIFTEIGIVNPNRLN